MKKILWSASILGLAISSSFSQAFFIFDNSGNFNSQGLNPLLPQISAVHAVGEGSTGQVIGSDNTFTTPNYDISYLWLAGTQFAGSSITPGAFVASGAAMGGIFHFYAQTGDVLGGAGIVTGNLESPGPGGRSGTTQPDGTHITIQLLAWFDPNGTTGYSSALASGFNTGYSRLTDIRLIAGLDTQVQDISGVPGFQVGLIPEPGITTLAGLGTATLMVFRRRKT